MLARLGFVASVLSENLSTSRTCRLRNATADRIRELTAANLASLGGVVTFLERHRIGLYRISSNIIPFGSHPTNGVEWWNEYAPEFRQLGTRLRTLGIRVSTHPGQFTVLNSPRPPIVRASIAELAHQARLLDALGADETCKIVIHVGGLYGANKSEAIGRFVTEARSLPAEVIRRLIVENDDRLFDAEDALEAGRRAGVPVVFDWLHHNANPCGRPIADALADIFATWEGRHGRPKIHLSSQAGGGPAGAHADYVDAADLLAFMRVAPALAFDCMLEAKQKDRALLRLREELRAYGVVESVVSVDYSTPPR